MTCFEDEMLFLGTHMCVCVSFSDPICFGTLLFFLWHLFCGGGVMGSVYSHRKTSIFAMFS